MIGIYPNKATANICPQYCIAVPRLEELPNPGDCPSGYAFVSNAPGALYGGFTYRSGQWRSIFDLINVRYLTATKVEYIDGILFPGCELILSGRSFTPDEVLTGINFIETFGDSKSLPIQFIYRNAECTLIGQTLL